MTLHVELSTDLEGRLRREAERHGVSPDQMARHLLETYLPAENTRDRLVTLLQAWIDTPDQGESTTSGEDLLHLLDEDRLSERKLFPDELKGVSW